MHRNQEGWIEAYKGKGAYWKHDGNPRRPHALLASKKHSIGFFNSRLIIPDEALLTEAASDLVDLFVEAGGNLSKIDGVMGPQTGATKLAELISLEVTRRTQCPCFSVSPAKVEHDTTRNMSFTEKEEDLILGNFLLPCEDVITTAGSVNLAIDATVDAGGFTLPYVLVLVNRSGLKEVRDKKIIALIEHEMPVWEAAECPPCKEGSEAILAKGENWARLNAEY